jgi:enoyl-[acyl-carrier protein] reductase/trans-2-enoyl-CoA reductase (NAD+)
LRKRAARSSLHGGLVQQRGVSPVAAKQYLYAKSINGDAFSDEIKRKTIETIIKADLGQVDLVVYSLAAPRRQHPVTGEVHNSTLKPIGRPPPRKG